jgi:hypothetical protein
MSDERNVLARWSQRKLAARRGEAVPEPEPADAAVDPAGGTTLAASQADQLPATPAVDQDQAVDETAAAGQNAPALPSLDDLDAQSDYTGFLARGVPEALTRAALRKLWLSDPVLANLDGLDHHAQDYNVVDQSFTAVQTSYRPGLGYIDEIEKEIAQVGDAVAKVGGDKPAESPMAGEAMEPKAPAGEPDAAGSGETIASEKVAGENVAGEYAAPDETRPVEAADADDAGREAAKDREA